MLIVGNFVLWCVKSKKLNFYLLEKFERLEKVEKIEKFIKLVFKVGGS